MLRRSTLALAALAFVGAVPLPSANAEAPAFPVMPGRFQAVPSQGTQGQATTVVLDTATGRAWLLVLPPASAAPELVPVPYVQDPATLNARRSMTPP